MDSAALITSAVSKRSQKRLTYTSQFSCAFPNGSGFNIYN